MNQINNKQEAAENPNRKRTLYLFNIIFLCILTILSLVFAMIVFFRLRTRGTDGIRQLYSQKQIEKIEETSAANARNELLLEIQSSLESGRSTTQMLREIFDESLVVVSGGKYYFYPLEEDVEKNTIESGTLHVSEGTVVYTGDDSSIRLSHGILLSDNNGKIDWNRLADSAVEECVVNVGFFKDNRFVRDGQFERNCRLAVEKGKHISLCLEMLQAPDEDAVAQGLEAVKEMTDLYGLRPIPEGLLPADSGEAKEQSSAGVDAGDAAATQESSEDEETGDSSEGAIDPTLLLRIRTEEDLSDGNPDKEEWTDSLKNLCQSTEKQDMLPVIGASLLTSAVQIDLSAVSSYDRWLIDHEDSASCPYSFSFWEYSTEGSAEGVPGKAIMYVRLTSTESEEDTSE